MSGGSHNYLCYAERLVIMAEYKINSYTVQKFDNKTLLPKGRKRTLFSVAEKRHPFPNKSIFLWETVKDGFKTEQEAEQFLSNLK